jgi:hypothetical protein
MPLLLEFGCVVRRKTTWQKVEIMVVGAILATGKRTVSAVLRVMGLSQERHYARYHHVLSRAVWSSLAASATLLRLLLETFARPNEPLVFGIDETIERRRGEKSNAKGIYRDPVRSSKEHFVKASGLRWVSVMLLTPIAWTRRPEFPAESKRVSIRARLMPRASDSPCLAGTPGLVRQCRQVTCLVQWQPQQSRVLPYRSAHYEYWSCQHVAPQAWRFLGYWEDNLSQVCLHSSTL